MGKPLDGVSIIAIKLSSRDALGDDGNIYLIDTMIDCEGDETEDADECISFVVKIAEDHWLVYDECEFNKVMEVN